jgi:hypothetical protein
MLTKAKAAQGATQFAMRSNQIQAITCSGHLSRIRHDVRAAWHHHDCIPASTSARARRYMRPTDSCIMQLNPRD